MGQHSSRPGCSQISCCGGLLGVARPSSTGTPLPRCLHARVPEDVGVRGRLLFVGDVHGCIAELRGLLDKVSFAPSSDTLVFVGDLVNKGPASGDVVRLARSLGAWCVRGNHEDELLEAWHRVGRYAESLDGYRHNTLYQVSARDIRWLQELPLSLTIAQLSVIVVHAGLVPGVALEEQRFRDLLWMRDVCRSSAGEAWKGLSKPLYGEGKSFPWSSIWSGPEHVVFGHDAKRRLQERMHATGLDTGCCYGRSLTGLLVPGGASGWQHRQLVHVEAEREYEPKRCPDT